MSVLPLAERGQAPFPLLIVVGPQSRQFRHWVLVRREFHPQVVCVAYMQQPTARVADRDTAMSEK